MYFWFPKKPNTGMVGNNTSDSKIGRSMRPNGQWTIDCGSIQAQAGGNVGSESSNDMDSTSSLVDRPVDTLLMTLLLSRTEDLHHGSCPTVGGHSRSAAQWTRVASVDRSGKG